MLVGTQQKLRLLNNTALDLYLGNNGIENVSAFKYLGIWIDTNLKWETHDDKLCAKLSQRIGILNRIRPYVSIDTCKLLFNAMICL